MSYTVEQANRATSYAKNALAEGDSLEASTLHHLANLVAREPLLELGSEAVECVGAHRVKAQVAIRGEGQRGDVETELLRDP